MFGLEPALLLAPLLFARSVAAGLPSKIYGVNLGSWYVLIRQFLAYLLVSISFILGWSSNPGCYLQVGRDCSLGPR